MPTFDVGKLTEQAVNAYNNNAFGDLSVAQSWATAQGVTLEEAMNALAGQSKTTQVATVTGQAVVQPTYAWEQLDVKVNPTIKTFSSDIATWNTYLNQGEKGAIRVDFSASILDRIQVSDDVTQQKLSTWQISLIRGQQLKAAIDGEMKSNGVVLWQETELVQTLSGGYVVVYPVAGVLPVIVAWLIVAAIAAIVVVVTVLAITISLFRLKKIEVTAAVDRAQATTDASINRQNSTTDLITSAVGKLPADQQVAALQKLLNSEQTYALTAEKQSSSSTDAGLTGMLKTPITIFMVLLGIGVIGYLVLKSGRI
jgi:hypothetical protein